MSPVPPQEPPLEQQEARTASANAPLRPGDILPHFEVTGLDGARVRYADIWQHRNLVLLSVPGDAAAAAGYAARVRSAVAAEAPHDAVCVTTADMLPALPSPGVVVADRWGDVTFAGVCDPVLGIPAAEEIVEWLRFTRMRCPECEGEWR